MTALRDVKPLSPYCARNRPPVLPAADAVAMAPPTMVVMVVVMMPVPPVPIVDLLGHGDAVLHLGRAGAGTVDRRGRRAGSEKSEAGGCDRSKQNFAHGSSERLGVALVAHSMRADINAA